MASAVKVISALRNLATTDLRSLALMRIALATIIIIDLAIRVSNLEAHYTNAGVLPMEALFKYAWSPYYFSLYNFAGNGYLQLIIFFLNLICAICLLLGYRTKVFTVLCWLFLLSIHNRNPLVHQGGDDLLRLMLFWGMFLPWGFYYSLDSFNINKINRHVNYSSIAVLGYLPQIGFVYLFSALLKTSPEWTREYTALYYALSFDQIVLPIGKFIYQFPALLKFLTAVVYHIELQLPALLIIPFYTGYCRGLFIVIILLLHTGIALCLNVGLFPLIGIAAMIGMLPTPWIERFIQVLYTSSSRLVGRIKLFSSMLWRKIKYPGIYQKGLSNTQSGILIFFCFYILNWNLHTIGKVSLQSYTNSYWLGEVLRIDQNWGMFAPGVFKDDGWFVFAGKSRTGKEIDLSTEKAKVNYTRAASVNKVFKEDRWRKYSEMILLVRNHHYRPYYCFYLLNKWNREHEEKLDTLNILYMKEVSLPNYKTSKPTKEFLCNCWTD